jgi:tripartite-type tricarboxylate transporter receptor subunit TctC
MKPPRRAFLQLTAAAAALATQPGIGWAQTYPARPLRWIVGFPPGGGADTVARILGPWLSERLGQQVVIENRPGASTNIAAQAVVNSPPDGYTLLFYGASTLINTSIFQNLPFNVQRDIAPVCGLVVYPMLLVAHPSLPARTVAELITHAEAHPGKVTMASFGTGSASHLAGGPRSFPRRRADGEQSNRRTGAGRLRCDGDVVAARAHWGAAGAGRGGQEPI